MNVIKLKRENNALDIALMVESATKTEKQEYDETAIVEALVREANCDRTLAKEVAATVTERLMKANVSEVSTSLIRSMVPIAGCNTTINITQMQMPLTTYLNNELTFRKIFL